MGRAQAKKAMLCVGVRQNRSPLAQMLLLFALIKSFVTMETVKR